MREEMQKIDGSHNLLTMETDCYHCHLPIQADAPSIQQDQKSFCCSGCLTVYQILSNEGLGHYYRLKKDQTQGTALSHYNNKLSFDYLDHEQFQKDYTRLNQDKEMSFFLEGVHCLACLWLIEKVKDQITGVKEVSLNMVDSTVKIVIGENALFAPVANYFNRLGYHPHPVKSDHHAKELKRKENKAQLTRLGIAAFCSGNIMLLAISLYAGAESQYKTVFSWLSALFYLPLATYASIPFYQSGWKALKNRQVSIDLPISLILIIGALASFISLVFGGEQLYFDSLGTFIFLILGTRYILEQIQKKNLSFKGINSFFSSDFVQRKKKSSPRFEQASIHSLEKGDLIRLEAGDTLPVDAKLNQDRTSINSSFLTGEHMPILLQIGEEVFAGCSILGDSAEFEVLKSFENSRLHQILSQIQNNWVTKQEFVGSVDKAASQLLLVSLSLALTIILFFSFKSETITGLHRALAVLIITCPCALALGTPLSLINALRSLFKEKILARNSHSLLKLSKTSSIFFDKTGTLTEGKFEVSDWIGQKDQECLEAAFSLESYSQHPIAVSLKAYISHKYPEIQKQKLENFQEVLGEGVSGSIKGASWEIKKDRDWDGYGSAISIIKDNKHLAKVVLQDKLKLASKGVIDTLHDMGLKTFILSGDNKKTARQVAKLLSIPQDQVIADCTPEDKQGVLSKYPNSVMVGDGLNDILALDSAAVGITLGGKIDLNLESSDIYLPNKRIESVLELLQFSKKINRIVKRNIIISLSYNCLGILAALLGLIGPLGAAILMPISSLTVILSSFLGSQFTNLGEK